MGNWEHFWKILGKNEKLWLHGLGKNMVTVFVGRPVSKNAFHFRGVIGYMSPIYTLGQNCASNPVCVRAVQKVQL